MVTPRIVRVTSLLVRVLIRKNPTSGTKASSIRTYRRFTQFNVVRNQPFEPMDDHKCLSMCSMNGPVLKESVHSQEQTVSARMINTGGSVAHMGQGFESGDIRKQPPTISNQQERPPEWPIGHERITRRVRDTCVLVY